MFTRKFKMAAIFVKLYTSLPIYRCKYLSNPSRIDRDAIFKDICNSRGNAPPPHKCQRGDTSAPLPNRSGRYQGTTPTTWLNFNTPCKSQLKNAWPFSPTINNPFFLTFLANMSPPCSNWQAFIFVCHTLGCSAISSVILYSFMYSLMSSSHLFYGLPRHEYINCPTANINHC